MAITRQPNRCSRRSSPENGPASITIKSSGMERQGSVYAS
jgi:hypothetical protein